MANAGHVSAAGVTSEIDGFMCEQTAKTVTNLYTAYSHILDGLCFSGGMAFGEMIEVDGQKVADARAVLKRLMPTSASTDRLLMPEDNLGQIQAGFVLSGQANTPDRASLTIRHNGDTMPALHGDARIRSTVTLKQYMTALENGDINSIAAGRRIEYTGRSMTPDLIKYAQSVALQEVLTVAGVLSVSEGYDDVFEWFAANGILTEGLYVKSGRTKIGLEKILKAVKGDFSPNSIETSEGVYSFNPIAELTAIIDLVRSRLQSESGGDLNPLINQTIDRASAGLQSLTVDRERYSRMNAVERFNVYLSERTESGQLLRPMNWGELVNSLDREDIVTILDQFFNVQVDLSAELGDLVLSLNHHMLMAQVEDEAWSS